MAIPTFHMDQRRGAPWPGLGTRSGTSVLRPRSPLAGARGCCIGPDEGPDGNERLDKPRLRTGDSRDLSGPLWWRIQAVDGPREAEGDGESTLLGARGRWPLGHPNPLNPEAGVSMRAYSPDGVIAVEERRSCACGSTRAGSLHPASTSHQGVSPNGASPRSRAPSGPGPVPGVLAVLDHFCEQPNRTTGHNCEANSHNARGARNAEPARREARGNLPATRESHWPPRSSRRWVTNSCASEACP